MKQKVVIIPAVLLAIILIVWVQVTLNGNCLERKNNSGKETDVRLYEEFLDNELELYIDKEMNEILADLSYGEKLSGEDAYTCVNLSELIQKVNAAYLDEDDPRMEYMEYAYLDCCNDNKPELALRFSGLMSADDMKLTMIIVQEEDRLFLRHAFEEWSRNSVVMTYFGYVYTEGSGGAFTGSREEYLIGTDGKAHSVYESVYTYEELTLDDVTLEIFHQTYVINDKTYHVMDEYVKEIENGEAFCAAYEEKYGKLTTPDEMDKLILKRQNSLGVQEKWMQTDNPEWSIVENKCYRDDIKYNDLQSEREREQKQKKALNDSWTLCSQIKGGYFIRSSMALHYNWNYALNAVVADYCNKQQIEDKTFNIIQAEPLDEYLYSITLEACSFDERDICFIVHRDSVLLGLEENTRYVMAADIREGDQATYPLVQNSYDTHLRMISYKEQAKINIAQPYQVNEHGLYSFETDVVYAMNHYLLREHAENDMEWNIDMNSVSMLAGGELNIIRCNSGERKVVMLLDTVNEQYAIIRGIDE